MLRTWNHRLLWLLGIVVLGLFIAAACSDNNGQGAQTSADADTAATRNVSEAAESSTNADATLVGTGLKDGLPDYDVAAAVFNSYWYSRYTLGNLVMMSGLGIPFAPPMDAVMAMVQAVDQGPQAGEHVTLPVNPALLRAVFAGGNPQFVNAFNGNPGDLNNYRWDPAKMDTTLTPAAQAQTIIKEVEWAKFFNTASWAGKVTDDFGAMDRFKGLVMLAGAKMQAAFALENLRNADGLFVAASRYDSGLVTVLDGSVRPADQYQMLQALSDVRMILQNADRYNDIYTDQDALAQISAAADELFVRISDLQPTAVLDLDLGAQAVAWFAATTHDAALQARALDLLATFGDGLIAAQRNGVIDRARSVRGLLEAARVLDNAKYRDAAAADLSVLIQAYDPETGHFDGLTAITDWEVGDILGALNSALANGDAVVDRAQTQRVFAGFFEAVVNRGGLLQAAPPKELEASPFELQRVQNALYFAYPGIPTPPDAGGPNGTAAVHASELTFNEGSGRWEVTNRRFDTAGAMHTSNEMIWSFGLVSAFPQVDITTVSAFPTVLVLGDN